MRFCLCLALLAGLLGIAHADTIPGFDRPGTLFSTDTVPVGHLAWEQGLPDYSYDSSADLRIGIASANTLLRTGLGKYVELQIGGPFYVNARVETAAAGRTRTGRGDAFAGLKFAFPHSDREVAIAALVTASTPSGDAEFSAGDPTYSAGLTAVWPLDSNETFGVYGNVYHGVDQTNQTLAASYGFPFGEGVTAYSEAAITTGDDKDQLIGTGLGWMVARNVQLDAYVQKGIGRNSIDWHAGLGISAYF